MAGNTLGITQHPSTASFASFTSQTTLVSDTHEDDYTKDINPNTGRRTFKQFMRKYFYEGQKLDDSLVQAKLHIDPDAPWHERMLMKHRQFFSIAIPYCFYNIMWWCLAFKHNSFQYFPTHYAMTITMVFGSMISGATSEGGGAVAFPVMTLVLHLSPTLARDFSLMSQSCGMVCATFSILFMKLTVEWHSVIFCSIGAAFGIVIGLEFIDDLLTSHEKKLIFVSVWFSFCVALFLLNREHKRKTHDSIPNFGYWQAIALTATGFLGGIFTAISGSGTDICSFSVLSLLFRISEKVSTPTSVILMAINTVIGAWWRQFMMEGLTVEAWKYLAVVVPLSTAGGPLGAFLASYCHRQVLAGFVYILDTLALVTALIVIPMTWQYWVLVVGLIIGGSIVFFILAKIGEKLLEQYHQTVHREIIAPTLDGYDNRISISVTN